MRLIYGNKESMIENIFLALFYNYRPLIECALFLGFVTVLTFQCKLQLEFRSQSLLMPNKHNNSTSGEIINQIES
jgi:hypothetical protein